MKRCALLLLLAVLLPLTGAGAQTYTTRQGYSLPDNELSVYYGQGSLMNIAVGLGGAFGTVFSLGAARVDEMSSSGTIALGYHRYVHRSIAVGGVAGYEGCTLRFAQMSGHDGNGNPVYESDSRKGNCSFFFIMPSVAVKWFSLPSVSMYSRVAAGAMLGISDETSKLLFAFQASPVGLDFGGMTVRGFLEAGFGCQGILIAGLRVCL